MKDPHGRANRQGAFPCRSGRWLRSGCSGCRANDSVLFEQSIPEPVGRRQFDALCEETVNSTNVILAKVSSSTFTLFRVDF